MKLVQNSFTEKHMDGAFKGVQYDYSETEIDWSNIDKCNPILEYIGEPMDYVNKEDTPSEEHYHKEIEYTEGEELIKTNSSGWSITGGLSTEYQGIGVSSGIGYTTHQSKTVAKIKSRTLRQTMTKKFMVHPKHKRRVAIVHQYQRMECKAKNVKVIFPKNAKIKCKIHDYREPSKPKTNQSYRSYIRSVLNEHIEDAGADPLTASLEGKYVWVESSVELDVSDQQPITE